MRNRHLSLLGYRLVQLPYLELEKVRGLEEAKQYLCQKVRELRLPFPAVGPQPSRGKEDSAPGG
ncbi:hypothetical protein JRQ81_018401 [Phrynocephalus forsythii]|uniref:RAP domain-containing protein n=1 Tax=Phrynocephalus forsythii TaxID=171643 RepID=A0A9Q1AZ99_9SAUR|nr:hypothetical protein JRQ81_018401 [Phrynocephalus forsythii]